MLGKETLFFSEAPFIEFQGVTFQMKCTWENYAGHWPGSGASINPNPPVFIINNVAYAFTYINLDGQNSYLEITPAAKERFSICLDCRYNGSGSWGDFTFEAGSLTGKVTSEKSPYIPMSGSYGTHTYHALSAGSLR